MSEKTRHYEVISCDGHLEIPPDAWVRHIPDEHLNRAPRLIKLRTGGEGWIVEGSPLIHNGQNVAAGRPLKVKGGSYWEPDGTPVPGTGDARQRLAEQDRDGIDAEVLYPPVFISRFIENIEDGEAYVAMVRAFNDFLAEDYCSVAPDRLIGNAVMPASGIEDAIAELKRAREIGLRSICLGSFPNGSGAPAPEDDLFWQAALDLGVPITAHSAMGDRSNPLLVQSARGTFDLEMSMLSRTMPPPVVGIVRMILSGVLDRFPDLRIYFAETNASWIPGLALHARRFLFDLQTLVWRRVGDAPERVHLASLLLRHRARSIGPPHARPAGHRPHHVGFGLPPFGLVVPRVCPVVGRDLRGMPGRCPPEGPGRYALRVLRPRPRSRTDADTRRLITTSVALRVDYAPMSSSPITRS